MTTEREEALELAREAVGTIGVPTFHTLHTWHEVFWTELVRLAKQRGAEEQKRKDAEICRRVGSVWLESREKDYNDAAELCAREIEEEQP